jgi:hypothetical protein
MQMILTVKLTSQYSETPGSFHIIMSSNNSITKLYVKVLDANSLKLQYQLQRFSLQHLEALFCAGSNVG